MKFFTKLSFFPLLIFLSTILLVQGCEDDPFRSSRELDFSTVPEPFDLTQSDTSYTKEGDIGIHVIEQVETPCDEDADKDPNHCEVQPVDQITLFITGRTSDGEIFRSTYANGNTQPALLKNLRPIQFEVDGQTVPPQIEGFRRGLLGMSEGEKRVIIVPPSLGYDDSRPGVNGFDLRDDTLRYDIELQRILD